MAKPPAQIPAREVAPRVMGGNGHERGMAGRTSRRNAAAQRQRLIYTRALTQVHQPSHEPVARNKPEVVTRHRAPLEALADARDLYQADQDADADGVGRQSEHFPVRERCNEVVDGDGRKSCGERGERTQQLAFVKASGGSGQRCQVPGRGAKLTTYQCSLSSR